jgi:hypothetical protein
LLRVQVGLVLADPAASKPDLLSVVMTGWPAAGSSLKAGSKFKLQFIGSSGTALGVPGQVSAVAILLTNHYFSAAVRHRLSSLLTPAVFSAAAAPSRA